MNVVGIAGLQVGVIFIREGHLGGVLHLGLVLSQKLTVNLDSGWCKSWCGDEFQRRVSDQLSCQPEEGLLKVVVGLGRDIVVLEVLLAVESDRLGLNLPLFNIDFVTSQNDWDVLANTDKVTVPVGYVLVGDTGRDIEHDDTALSIDVVSITETTKLFLSSSVPDVELNGAQVCCKGERVDLNTKGSDVLLLELSGQMALDEGGLSSSSITNEHKLEGGCVLCFGHFVRSFLYVEGFLFQGELGKQKLRFCKMIPRDGGDGGDAML